MGQTISGKELLNLLQNKGAKVVRSKRSHYFIELNGRYTVIPIHGNKDLPKGTLRKILRDLDLQFKDLKK